MRSKKSISSLLVFLLVFTFVTRSSARTWRPAGQPTIKGDYEDVVGRQVKIRTDDGISTVPYSELSPTDKAVVRTKLQEANRTSEAANLDRGVDDSRPFPATRTPESGQNGNEGLTRTWTDLADHKMVAEFVRVEDPLVFLRVNGTITQYPLIGFCTADQEWIEVHKNSVNPDIPSVEGFTPPSHKLPIGPPGIPDISALIPPDDPTYGAGGFLAGPIPGQDSGDVDAGKGNVLQPGDNQGMVPPFHPPAFTPPPPSPTALNQPPGGFSRIQSPGQPEGMWILRCDGCGAEFQSGSGIKEGDPCPKCSDDSSGSSYTSGSWRIRRGVIKGALGICFMIFSGIAWVVRRAINP